MIDFEKVIKKAKKLTPSEYEAYWAEFNAQGVSAKKLEFLQDYGFIDANEDFEKGNLEGFAKFLKEFYDYFKGGKDNVTRLHYVKKPVSKYLEMEYYAYMVSKLHGSKIRITYDRRLFPEVVLDFVLFENGNLFLLDFGAGDEYRCVWHVTDKASIRQVEAWFDNAFLQSVGFETMIKPNEFLMTAINNFRKEDKYMKDIIIVTGGSSGLGKEIAAELVRRQENVCLIARSAAKLEKVKSQLAKLGKTEVVAYAGDVSDESFVKRVFKEIGKKYELTMLVNCAGAGRFGTIYENNAKMLSEVFSGVVFGTILMTTNALPLLKAKAESGEIVKIVNIVSLSGLRGFKFESAYCAAKAAQQNYAEVLRQELFGTNIKVMNVYPGGIDTPFWNKNRNYVSPEVQKTFAKPEEVAKMVVDNLYGKESLVLKDLTMEQTHMNLQ